MPRRRVIAACIALSSCRIGFTEQNAPDAASSVHLKVTGKGVVTAPEGIACIDDCVAPVTGPITITATAAEAWRFDHFDPPCSDQPTCSLAPGETTTATFVADPITANRVFVTSQVAVLDAAGRGGLDAQCQARATAGGLTGTFIAFVSTSTQHAVDRLTGSRGWIRVDGLPVLDQRTDLGDSELPRGVALDELGQPTPRRFTMTGSDGAGRALSGNSCMDWSSSAGNTTGGISDAGTQFMVGFSGSLCAGLLYCFEVGKVAIVATKPPAFPVGRYVFVARSFDPSTGIAAADLRCAADATAAGLPGSYKAALATTTRSVIEHTGPLGGIWRRADGALVTRGGLEAGNYDTHFARAANGTPVIDYAMIGAGSLTERATLALSCTDWSSTTGEVSIVFPFRMTPYDAVYTTNCQSLSLICVQTQ